MTIFGRAKSIINEVGEGFKSAGRRANLIPYEWEQAPVEHLEIRGHDPELARVVFKQVWDENPHMRQFDPELYDADAAWRGIDHDWFIQETENRLREMETADRSADPEEY